MLWHRLVAITFSILLSFSSRLLALPGQAQNSQENENRQREYQQYIDAYPANVDAARKQGKAQELQMLRIVGGAYQTFGKLPEALKLYQQALPLARSLADRMTENYLLSLMGTIHQQLGDDQGIAFYRQQLEEVRKAGLRESEALLLENLGQAHFRLDNLLSAMEVWQQRLKLVRELKHPQEEWETLVVLASGYENLHDTDQALSLLQQALKLAEQFPASDSFYVGQSLSNLAGFYLRSGNADQAIAYQQKAIQAAEHSQNSSNQVVTELNRLAMFYAQLGQLPKVVDTLQQSLQHLPPDEKSFRFITLGYLGRAYYLLGDYAKALDAQQQALTLIRQMYPASLHVSTSGLELYPLQELSLTLLKLGRVAEVEKTVRQSIEDSKQLLQQEAADEQNFLPWNLDEQKVISYERSQDSYRILQQVLVAEGKPEAALQVAEESRARAFADLLAHRLNGDSDKPVAPPTLDQIRQIAREQNSTLVQYSVLYDDEFMSGLRLQHEPKPLQLLIWVVQPGGKITFRQVDLATPLRGKRLQDIVLRMRQAIGARGRGVTVPEGNGAQPEPKPSGPPAIAGLRQLYQLLIDPIADLLPTDPNAHITFIPQQALFLVPFAALQNASGQYLIENHTVLMAPSIQVLQLTHEERLKQTTGHNPSLFPLPAAQALVVGNPVMPSLRVSLTEAAEPLPDLPGAEKEANAIANLLKTRAITRQQATKAFVVKQMAQARLIHLATHGLLDTRFGFQSALALAPSQQMHNHPQKSYLAAFTDGFLTAREILKLKLTANLVVLSACDTGRGAINGDGVVGLSRAFIGAGVPSVLVSLWSIPDAPTASLMIEFYRNLQHSTDKAQALRRAMLTTLQQYPKPADWAAFTLIGESE